MRKVFWGDLTTGDFAGLDPERAIAVLPVAAIEQHGPHLPVATDAVIADGMLAEVVKRLPDDLSVLILPTQTIGKSDEHIDFAGTVTLSAETAIEAWTAIGEAVARAGLRKLVIVNSHGGNVEVMTIVTRALRVRHRMLGVACSWSRLGYPEGLFTDEERAVGIHAGDIETSLMLHFRPDLVRMDLAENFVPATVDIAREFEILRPTGYTPFAWLTEDLHPKGALGDATRATAEKGAATAEYQAGRFIALLRDMTRFRLERLA